MSILVSLQKKVGEMLTERIKLYIWTSLSWSHWDACLPCGMPACASTSLISTWGTNHRILLCYMDVLYLRGQFMLITLPFFSCCQKQWFVLLIDISIPCLNCTAHMHKHGRFLYDFSWSTSCYIQTDSVHSLMIFREDHFSCSEMTIQTGVLDWR